MVKDRFKDVLSFLVFPLSLPRGPTFGGTSQLEKLRSTSVWHYIP